MYKFFKKKKSRSQTILSFSVDSEMHRLEHMLRVSTESSGRFCIPPASYGRSRVHISARKSAMLRVFGGSAIAQAVSRWLPAAAAWVRARVWSCGICGGQKFSPSTSVFPASRHSTNCSTITIIYHTGLAQ
jgi:hypothetical protein